MAQWESKENNIFARFGKTHVDYWKRKLIKRRYRASNGKQVEIANFYIRLSHLKRREWFDLARDKDPKQVVREGSVLIVRFE